MKFSTREEIDCPAQTVFAALSDFAYFEDALRERGVRIERVSEGDAQGLGTAWVAEASLRGHVLSVRTEVSDVRAGSRIASQSRAGMVEALAEFTVESLGRDRSRLCASVDIRPVTLAGRLFLQPLKLAKGNLQDRFDRGVTRFARDVEAGRIGPRRQ